MLLSEVVNTEILARINFRQRVIRKRQLREHRYQVINAFKNKKNHNQSTTIQNKKKPIIIVLYER